MTPLFTCDYIQFNEKGFSYDPFSDNTLVTISLDTSLASDLMWPAAKEQAAAAKKILWNLEFDLSSVSLFDPMALASFLIAIRTFNEELFLPFQEQSFGVCLYQGPLLIPFKWNLGQEEAFTEWRENYEHFPEGRHLYCIEVFSEYVHRLAAALPDGALPLVLFEAFDGSEAHLAQLLSREHFSYIYVGLKNHSLPMGPFNPQTGLARVGITLPLHVQSSKESFKLIDHCIGELKKQQISFRLVSESHLTESWDGLDTLLLFSDFLSKQGKRKAQGFAAAGGQIVVLGKPIGIEGEIPWDRFRGRGI